MGQVSRFDAHSIIENASGTGNGDDFQLVDVRGHIAVLQQVGQKNPQPRIA
jgi:hypothetical protein